MVQIDEYKVCKARWGLEKNKSLSTSCDNDKDTSSIGKSNFYLHQMKKQPPTTYYDIAH